MKIVVKEILTKLSNGYRIKFASPFGFAEGIWKGSAPQVLKEYDIELGVDDKLIWNSTILKSSKENFSISSEKNFVILEGKLESIVEDVVCVSLNDSIVMISTVGIAPPLGTFITAKIKGLFLFDTGI